MPLSDDQELRAALFAAAHPLRLDLLQAFASGAVERPIDAAVALGAPTRNVRHHIQLLHKAGMLELTDALPVDTDKARYSAGDRARRLIDALSLLR
jgi:hypothetical protein